MTHKIKGMNSFQNADIQKKFLQGNIKEEIKNVKKKSKLK